MDKNDEIFRRSRIEKKVDFSFWKKHRAKFVFAIALFFGVIISTIELGPETLTGSGGVNELFISVAAWMIFLSVPLIFILAIYNFIPSRKKKRKRLSAILYYTFIATTFIMVFSKIHVLNGL